MKCVYVGDWRRSHECQDTPFVTAMLFESNRRGNQLDYCLLKDGLVCARGPFRVDSDIDHWSLFQPVVEWTAGSVVSTWKKDERWTRCSAYYVMSWRSVILFD